MVDPRLKRLHGAQRRRFLKLMGIAGAAVGLERSELLNYIAGIGGTRLAQAATNSQKRSVGISGPNGCISWFTQLWPVPGLAQLALSDTAFATRSPYLYVPEHGHLGDAGFLDHPEGGKPFYYGPDAPWCDHTNKKALRPVTAMMAGNDETHSQFPTSAARVSASASLPAAIAAIQAAATPAIVPVMAIDPVAYGTAQGAPDVVTASSADGLIDLFNSAASQLTLKSEGDQRLFETYYNALVGLRRASGRSSWQPQLAVTKGAARLIGLNFAQQLTPDGNDETSYGITEMLALAATDITDNQKIGLAALGRALMIIARSFKLGLTNSAVVGMGAGLGSFTDPHAIGVSDESRVQARNTTKYLGRMLDGFYNDLDTAFDPEAPSEKLSDTTVMYMWGDTPKTPLQIASWPDATPSDTNWIYCMGQGHIQPGWFGQVHEDGSASGWDSATGEDVPDKAATETSTSAGAAVTYAVARGNIAVVTEHYSGPPLDGIIA